MNRDSEGRVVVVTGGASGIGAAVCRHFVSRGATVWVGDLVEGDLRDVFWQRCDVSREEEVRNLLEEVLQVAGRIDVVVNNAGIQPLGIGLEETTPALMRKTMAVNVEGVV